MPLKVTYMTLPPHADAGRRQNIGDRVIHLGVRNLMRCAIGPHEPREIDIARNEAIPADTEVLVVCGTPQIADGQDVSPVARRTAEVASADVPVRINLGAGAFYFDAFGPDRAAEDAAFAERLRQGPNAALFARYAGFDLCVARDRAAAAALHALGVPAIALPCPGFFAPLFQPVPVLRHDRPLIAVLNGGVSFWNRVAGDVEGFYRRLHDRHPDALFLAHDEEDCEMLAEFGIPHLAFDQAEALMECLAAHRRLLSLRVHAALPAWTLGLGVTLLGLDRRALLGEDFGASLAVLPLREEADLQRAETALGEPLQDEPARAAWLAQHLADYTTRIRAAIADKLGPQPPGEEPRPEVAAPALLAAPGRYWSRLFHSTDDVFDVPLDRMRSEHPARQVDGAMTVTANGGGGTLLFGPYILIPRGRWRATLRLSLEPPPSEALSPRRLSLIAMKGHPGAVLAEATVAPHPAGINAVLEFANPRDLGQIEILLRGPEAPLAPGWRLTLTTLRFERLGPLENDA